MKIKRTLFFLTPYGGLSPDKPKIRVLLLQMSSSSTPMTSATATLAATARTPFTRLTWIRWRQKA
ncbi:MAG: hypothetical protein ACE362_05250 [Phaeodactylibacter xiamenensis]|uniref:hypothetical protein n=1 Tax=Phaeodactylibacter xiamenensis TaxID=1524460 RepID=UPI0026A48296